MTTKFEGTSKLAVVLIVGKNPYNWFETIHNIGATCRNPDIIALVDGSVEHATWDVPSHVKKLEEPLVQTVDDLVASGFDLILVITAPVVFPRDALKFAASTMDGDPRVGTFSFLSNAAGYLSYPYRNTPIATAPAGHNADTLTEILRSNSVVRSIPIPVCDGAAVLLSRSALAANGSLIADLREDAAFALAEFSLRITRKGFINRLDLMTFVLRPRELDIESVSILDSPVSRRSLSLRHHFFPGIYDSEKDDSLSQVGQAINFTRGKVDGLRILIDGSALGPQQMGTQVMIAYLCGALAAQNAVAKLYVGISNALEVPAYADFLKQNPKISFVDSQTLTFPGVESVDILHRPFQPHEDIPWQRWREVAKRVIITVQDLIAYRNGSYFTTWPEWQHYRSGMKNACKLADGIIVLTDDVRNTVLDEQLPVRKEHVFTNNNGLNHIDRDAIGEIPSEFLRRHWSAAPFCLVMGATYAHKNRDLAVQIWKLLRERGLPHRLVMVGASAPFGSSRVEEAIEGAGYEDDILALPDVNEAERYWLLRNCALVLSPTSAEGFGLLPFEAAMFGHPYVTVSFGPYKETLAHADIPKTFDPKELADFAYELLTDDKKREANIKAARLVADTLTWEAHAKRCIDFYFQLLSDWRR